MDHNTTKMYIEYRYPKDIFPNLCHKNGKAINNSMNTRGAKEGMIDIQIKLDFGYQ